MQEGFYNVATVAKLFGVDPETVRRWARSGVVPSVKKKSSSHWTFPKKEIDDLIDQGIRPGEPELVAPRNAIAVRDYDLNSRGVVPSPDYFVKIVQHIAEFVEGMGDVEVVDGPHDKKRDVIGYRRTRYQKRELCYIQCKKMVKITEDTLKKELDDLKNYLADPKKLPFDKPDKIYFALSTNVPAGVRDKLKKYCRDTLGMPLHFWCPRELNTKIQSDLRVQRLIEPELDAQSDLSAGIESGSHKQQQAVYNDQDEKLNESLIVKSGELIEQGKTQEAKDFLLELIGKLSIEPATNRKDLAKAYNNLALCYTKMSPDHDEAKAIEHFEKALELNPELFKARGNLILAYLRVDPDAKATELRYHRSKLETFVNDKDMPDNDYFFVVYVLSASLEAVDGAPAAISFMEKIMKSATVKARGLQDDKDMLHVLAFLYFRNRDSDKARKIVDATLKKDPKHFESQYLDVLLKLLESFGEHDRSGHDVLPDFKDGDKIEAAFETLTQLVERAKVEARGEMIDELKHNLFLCYTWLQRFGKKIPPAKKPEVRDEMGLVRFSNDVYEKRFREAFEIYQDAVKNLNLSPNDKMDVADMFMHYGAPEYAQKIFDENEDLLKGSFSYWINRSTIEVLIGNTDLAKEYSFRARDMTKPDDKDRETVLGHVGAVLLRDPKEGDRIMQNAFQMQEEFPEDKILTGYNTETDHDKIIEIMMSGKERMERIAADYENNSIPSYTLQKIQGKTFFECWANRHPGFPWIATEPAPVFYEQQLSALRKKQPLILDYQSLLSLSQAKLLGYLERITSNIWIDFKLFEKIQTELLRNEHPVLREVWEYIRSARVQFYFSEITLSPELQKLEQFLESWLVRSIEIARQEKMTFVSDDLRTMKFALNQDATAVNTFGILTYLKSEKLLDKKAYSKKLGQLAKCFYTFIAFDADDLHEIVWQDDYEITSGSYHLVNQIHRPGSEGASFMNVFTGFIVQLWRSGATSDDKVKWLGFITEQTTSYIKVETEKGEKPNEEMQEIVSAFSNIWVAAIRAAATVDDLEMLKEKLDDLTGEILEGAKESIAAAIDARIKSLKPPQVQGSHT
jgi:tetratricopeptide (TPR) repeat protein